MSNKNPSAKLTKSELITMMKWWFFVLLWKILEKFLAI